MMGAAVVLLTILLCICVVVILLKQKNIDSAEEQLRRINVTHTNGRVQLTSPDRGTGAALYPNQCSFGCETGGRCGLSEKGTPAQGANCKYFT